MLKLIFSLFISLTLYSDLNAGDLNTRLQILIVDESEKPLVAESVNWWYLNDRSHKHSLSCSAQTCASWLLNLTIDKPVVLSANASKIVENDSSCRLLYYAESILRKQKSVVKIKMKFTGKACKSSNNDK